MRLVIDTNILIAALIKNSFTRQFILFSDLQLISPEITTAEINKYRSLILEKSGLSEKEFKTLFSTLLGRLTLFQEGKYLHCISEAMQLIGKYDPGDVPFLALALSIKNDGIWSDDNHFQQQKKVRIWKTKELIEYTS